MDFSALEKKYHNFYAPAFEVNIEGENLFRMGVEISSVTVDNTLEGADSFTLLVSNSYDITRRELKWMDSIFEPGKNIEIKLGYTDKFMTMLVGLVTSVRASFPASGMPFLEVTGFDLSHKMMKGRQSYPWPANIKDNEIAGKIASKYSLGSSIEDTKVKYPDVKQDQESDFEFLTRLAQRNHFEFFVFGRTLYFRAPANDEDPILSLEWGETLISFSPELDLTNQVSEVEVRGWDVTAKKEIIGTAKKGDEQGTDSGRKTGSELVQNAYNTKIIEHIRLPLFFQEEADRMARTILNRHAEGLVKGAGQTIGIPELLAGKNIELKGLGTKFSKAYYIESTSHVISGSGYQTTFNVKENTI